MQEQAINSEEEKKDKKRRIILLILYILTLLVLILTTFTFSNVIRQNKADINNIIVGQVRLDMLNNESSNILLDNAYPMTYEESMSLEPFEFRVTNGGTLAVIYRLRLSDVKKEEVNFNLPNERISDDRISYSLIDKNTKQVIKTGSIKDLYKGILISEKLKPRYSRDFEFRIWVNKNSNSNTDNKYYMTRINLDLTEILN